MTKDTVAAGVAFPEDVVQIARDVAADLDDIHFDSRSWNWIDDAREIIARAIMADRNRTASPVQAGIDPLVAECAVSLASMVKEWVDGGIKFETNWHTGLQSIIEGRLSRIDPLSDEASEAIHHLSTYAAMLERKAEQATKHIAALTEANFALRNGIDDWRNDAAEMAGAAKAAESLLAEAREALERIRKQDRVTRFRGTERQFYEDGPCGKIARATLSRLKPGEKGGSV